MRERGSPLLKAGDRYGGIPAVALLGALRRRRRAAPRAPRSIALVKLSAIGDTVLVSGPLEDLRAYDPDLRVTLIAGASNAAFARLALGADEVVEVRVHEPRTLLALLRPRFDVLLDFGQWSRWEAAVSWAARARFTVGFRTPGQHRHYAYDRTVDHSRALHELENYRNVVRSLGVPAGRPPRLRVPAGAWEAVSARLGLTPGGYGVFHAWPGGFKSHRREWPAASWAALARRVGRGRPLVLTGSADDAPRSAALARACGGDGLTVTSAAGLPLGETLALLARAAFVVGVDTGIMHCAWALGAPTVSLHGPSTSRRWGPQGPRSVAVDSPCPGAGFLSLGFEYTPDGEALPCMEAITPDAVHAALTRLGAV